MSEFSRETLLNIIETDHVQCGDASVLARMALAAMDSEPAIADCDPEVYEKGVSVCLVAIPKETAEVICQNITAATGCKVDWHYFGGRVHIKALIEPSQPAPVVPVKIPGSVYQVIYHECGGFVDCDANAQTIWNACRAAMLAAAPQSPGSEPSTVQGKWIPVSERMPEDSGRYWCYVEEQNDLGKSHYQWNCSWNGDQWWVESENGGIVTHWMPLTASPQEAINALISVVSRNEPEGN
ncbi:DUF551 domain-containing protein [Klebsiella variicola]|uniref:DUF551 domain-containing protein n=1 Tax=Klebsiella variicola TaxID=244366 RepID=UPI002FF48E2E